jgi:RHS repeat-associated protein
MHWRNRRRVRRRTSGRSHYNYNRDYDPATGRYVESDPIGLWGGVNAYLYARAAPLALSDMLGLCPDEPNKCEQLLAEMQKLIDAQRVKPGDPKGLAQRYRQLGRASLPADVRQGYIEQYQKRQRQLQKKEQEYMDEGCGDPPPWVLEWANKEYPTPPVQVPDSSPDGSGNNQNNAIIAALLSLLLQSSKYVW